MVETSDFDTLLFLFGRPGTLPALPMNTMRLLKEVDGGEVSIGRIEAIIAADPSLTADILRLSNTGEFGGCPGGSLGSAIFLIGERSIKALAVSSLVQALLRSKGDETLFDADAHIAHSMFVGLFARYLTARATQQGKSSGCTPDEAFAAGMLHDLPVVLLARVAPKIFNRLFLWAKRRETTISAAFQAIFGQPLSALGAQASHSLGLPPLFCEFFEHAEQPWMSEDLYMSLCAVAYADGIALGTEWRMEGWSVGVDILPEVIEEVELPAEELDLVVPKIGATVAQLMASCQQKAPVIASSRR